jgi:hypothetical protein
MKKVLALLAIAGFVACNNAETPATPVDSPKVEAPAADSTPATPVDSPKVEAPAADSTKK